MLIATVEDPQEKSDICSHILQSLPEWFAVEASIIEYTNRVRSLPLFAAYGQEHPVGFIAVKTHNPYTAEICVMGVLPGYHRQGIGSRLIRQAEAYCLERGHIYLTVKTLDASAVYEPYERTRRFYRQQGFVPLEVFPSYWDASNPCLLLAKHLPCQMAGLREKGEY